MPRCAGWRLTPYPAYIIWRRVPPLSRPGKRSAAGQSRRVPRLRRMAADALSGLRYLAPGSAPSQARQAQRRRAIYPAPCRVVPGILPGTVPCLCRMAADALSGLRYLAPGSAP
ncbi:hypothetical protein C5672_06150 [Klebsiella quasipneumoniae]|nr:hypothetical protein C5672_06150 [Klebsiella quasipneumoniae]PQM87619.1 hypothetical protein C5673_19545 [Klebsiella quasipneumoniae]